MNKDSTTLYFKTIAQMHNAIGISKPRHPLFSITRFEDYPPVNNEHRLKLIADFYQITLKTDCSCKIQYGQTDFDFDEGVISCFAPKQVSIIDKDFKPATKGWQIAIHPDFLRTYALSQKIKTYGFFDYVINEALILSEDEQTAIESIFVQIEKEYKLPIDNSSQDVIISFLDVLVSLCNRYYNRQFITRNIKSNALLSKAEEKLNSYIADKRPLPSAADLAGQLNLSTKYLSDCLKQLTGQTTQQIIHNKLIEQAKDLLASTELTISEIAYQLGFEYAQSFSKLFKNKTSQTPNEFRHSLN